MIIPIIPALVTEAEKFVINIYTINTHIQNI